MDGTALRLILDQGVPRDAAKLLRQLGYDCTHVGEFAHRGSALRLLSCESHPVYGEGRRL